MSPLFEYPVFEADQVLTANNLNDAIEYLTRQDLDTRRKLIGIGIVCGLEVSSDGSSNIDISKGVGVTSLGYLISQEAVHLTYYRPFADKAEPPYSYFGDDNSRPAMWELYTAQEYLDMEDDDMVTVAGNGDFDLTEMAVLLYLEIENKDLQKCIGENCLEKGINRIHRVKRLLIAQEDLLTLIAAGSAASTESELLNILNTKCNLPAISIERLNYNLSDLTSLNLDGISSWQKLKDAYGQVAEPAAIRIGKALFESYEAHQAELKGLYNTNPFEGFQLTNPAANALFDLLRQTIDDNELAVQYAYDLLRDLMLAYNEFIEASTEYLSVCCPDASLFPLHLMLDKAIPDEGVKSVFRHYFIPSPALNGQSGKLEKLKTLFQRMVRMVEVFKVSFYSTVSEIKITPAKWTCNPLSRRAMGFYYPISEEQPLYRYWSYELARKCKSATVPSYHANQYATLEHVLRPLLFDISDYNHFRIEGHIGQEYQSVKQHLENQIRNFNLSFDVLGIKLSRDHLDVEVEDSCFNDLQVSYKCNRDEYLRCINSITVFIGNIVEPLEELFTKYPRLASLQVGGKGSALPFINTLGDLYLILQLYYYQLQQVEATLPEHIKNFDYPLFRVPHFIVYAFTLIIQIILEMLSNNIREVQLSYLQFMAVKTLFERVIDDCMDSKFKSLYDMFQERKLQLQLGKLFPGYVSGRAGLEHIAGVEPGGTFILVYDEIPDQPRDPEEPDDDPDRDPRDPCFRFSRALVLKAGILEFAHGIYKQSYLTDDLNFFAGGGDDDLKERTARAKFSSAAASEFAATAGRDQSQFQSRASFEPRYRDPDVFIRDVFGSRDRIRVPRRRYRVVADFAVPYRCCSSCLAVEELPRDAVEIQLQGEEFCRKDTKRYPFDLEPDGGEVKGDGVVQDENGNYYFQPSEVKGDGEEVQITYSSPDGEQASITVQVYNPQASFTENRDKIPGSVILENTSSGADSYEWTIHDTNETFSTKNLLISPEDYDQDSIVVTLVARRGPCSDNTDRSQVILRDPSVKVSISLPSSDFCKNDNPVPFSLSPDGGTLSPLNGVVQMSPTSPYLFNPQIASGKQISFTYAVQGNSASITVNIHNPKAGFELLTNDGQNLVLQDKSLDAEAVKWFVNDLPVDADGDTLTIPVGRQSGRFVNVRIVATAWRCRDEFEMDIPLKGQQTVIFDLQQPKGSSNYSYCNNDSRTYLFSTQPVGGTIAGDDSGLNQDASGQWVFKPLGVAAGSYTFDYMGQRLTVTVGDVPELKFTHKIIRQTSSIALVEFELQSALTGNFHWSFSDGQSAVRNYSGPETFQFSIDDGQTAVNAQVTHQLANGCTAVYSENINLTNGGNFGSHLRVISVTDWTNDPLTANLSRLNFTAHTAFMTNANKLENDFRDPAQLKKIKDGSANAAMAKEYEATMAKTLVSARKLKSRSDQPLRNHLSTLYLAQFEDVLRVIASQESDLSKNSNLYKLAEQANQDLAVLTKLGANINPNGSLKAMLDRYTRGIKGHSNAEALLKQTQKLLQNG